MKQSIKKVNYKNAKNAKSHFDLVSLEEILAKTPIDHNQFENHKISFYAIILITEKTGTHSINYQEHPYNKGTVFTIRKDSIHKFHNSKAKGKLFVFTENFVVRYLEEQHSFKLFQLFNELLGSPKVQLLKGEFTEIEQITRQIEQEYLEVKDTHSLEIVRSLLHVLITKLFRIKSSGNDIFENPKYISQFIQFQNLVETACFENRKVSYYAKAMNITPRTLNNITHSIIHKSAKAFINEILITQIKRLLINTPLTINEIAYKVGFAETTNLFKYFKKYTGVSPNSFRSKHR